MKKLYEKARNAVKRAVRRGEITKPESCENCGGDFPARLMCAAHADPTKVLEVTWLCRICHGHYRRERDGIVREDRFCKHCKKLIPHEGESDAEYERRSFCDQDCYRGYRRTNPIVRQLNHPPCPQCGSEVLRRPGERSTEFRRRKYCSPECSRTAASEKRWGKVRAEKERLLATMKCEGCGGPMKTHKGESVSDLKKRKYCSLECRGLQGLQRSTLAKYNAAARERRKRERKVRELNEAAREYARNVPFTGFPDPRRRVESVAVRMEPQFEVKYCDKHPREALNIFGKCPACVTAERWAGKERNVIIRPSSG